MSIPEKQKRLIDGPLTLGIVLQKEGRRAASLPHQVRKAKIGTILPYSEAKDQAAALGTDPTVDKRGRAVSQPSSGQEVLSLAVSSEGATEGPGASLPAIEEQTQTEI